LAFLYLQREENVSVQEKNGVDGLFLNIVRIVFCVYDCLIF